MDVWVQAFQAIALLCQSTGTMGVQEVQDGYQLKCQHYYVRCLETKSSGVEVSTKLKECILQRETRYLK